MTVDTTASSAGVAPLGRRHMDRGVASFSPGRQPAGRLSVSQRRLGVQCVFVLTGTVDLAGAPRLGELLEQAARSRDPLVLDLSHAGPRGAVDMALLVHVVRWVYRRHPDLRIVCPPGPTRAALERSEVHARVEIVADRRALSATSSPPWRSDARALRSLAEPVRKPRAETSARRARLLAEAAMAIEQCYAEPELALGDIAHQIATSERQLQRIFADLGASAFRDELAAVRMQHGAQLLHDSYMTVTEIARHVGYRQASQFSKAFRRFYGVTPTAFVRQLA